MTAEEFKSIRELLGLKQGAFGASIGKSRRTIIAYETGASPIPVAVAIAVRSLANQGETGNG